MKNKIFWISLGLIALIIGGVSLYISLLDWNAHKVRLSSQFSSLIGEKIEFSGDLDVSLVPHPKLSARDVIITNPITGATLAKAQKIDMAVTLSSILHGAPDIQSLEADNVEVWIVFDKDGKSNWHHKPRSDSYDNNMVSVQSLNIRNGIVHMQNKTYDFAFDLTDFAAEIQAETLESGPYQVAGNFMYDKSRYGLALSVDNIMQLDDIGFHIRLQHPATDSKFIYDASYNKQTGEIKGSLSGEFLKTADVVNMLAKKSILERQYNIPLQFSVQKFDLASEKIDISNFTVNFNPFFIGTGNFLLPRKMVGPQPKNFEVKYQIISMDFMPIFEILKQKFMQYKDKIYAPDSIWNGDFDIAAVDVKVSDKEGGVWKNANIKGSWQQNVLQIDDFYAEGAGNINITASGKLFSNDGKPQIKSGFIFEGEDFKIFLNSLGIDLQAPAINAYKNINLGAEATLSPTNLQIEDIQLQMDKAIFSGSIQTEFANKKYLINLKADKVNFDNYIFAYSKDAPHDIISVLRRDAKQLTAIKDYNFETNADISNSVFRGVLTKNISFKAIYNDNKLDVERYSINDLVETSVEGTAYIKDIDNNDPQVEMFEFNLKSQNIRAFADKFAIPLPKWQLFDQKKFLLNGYLSGDLQKAEIKADMMIENDNFSYQGTIEKAEDELNFDGKIGIKTQKLEELLSEIEFDTKDSKVLRGVLNGYAQISGNKSKFQISKIDAKLGSVQYDGNIDVMAEDKYYLQGNINASEINFSYLLNAKKAETLSSSLKSENTFLARSDFGKLLFDFSPYNKINFDINLKAARGFYEGFLLTDFSGKISNKDSVLNIQSAEFKNRNSEISFNAAVHYEKSPKIVGNAMIKNLLVEKLGGSVYALSFGSTEISGNFESSMASFEDMLAALSGKFTLKTQKINIKGIDLAKIREDLKVREYSKGLFQMMQNNLSSGNTEFDPITVNMEMVDGVINIEDILLKNAEETAKISGDVNLHDWRINISTLVKYTDLADIAPYTFSFNGPLNNPAVDVSVENIARKYDEHWKAIAANNQAQKAETERILNQKTEQAQQKLASLNDVYAQATSLLEQYNGKSLQPETDVNYKKQSSRLEEIGKEIQQMQPKLRQSEISEKDVSAVSEKSDLLKGELEEIQNKIKQYLHNDIQQSLNIIDNKEKNIIATNKNIYDEFNQMLEKGTEQLEKINAEQYIKDNEKLSKYKTQMETQQNIVLNLRQEFSKKSTAITQMKDGADTLSAIRDLINIPDLLEKEYGKMQKIKEDASVLMTNIISQRQEVYMLDKLAQERKRQKEAAENAGNLLIENTGDDNIKYGETADLTDQKNNGKQDTIHQQNTSGEYRVLIPMDDNLQVTPASGDIIIRTPGRQNMENSVNRARQYNILQPADGEIHETSGSIIVR